MKRKCSHRYYKDDIEIILTQSNCECIKLNRLLYGYGYDAYIYVKNQYELQENFKQTGVKTAIPLTQTDYNNREFVIEDVDGRYIAFRLKELKIIIAAAQKRCYN